jgi:DNA-binding transcriptional regulator YhcF (GntR family)
MLQLDLAAATPAYEQIASGLRALLVAASLQPGDRLPTVRQLAIDLGVHHNTVAEAYRQLAAEGWLELRRGRGATVIERASPSAAPSAPAEFARRLEELIAKAVAAGLPRERLAAALLQCAASLRRGVTP